MGSSSKKGKEKECSRKRRHRSRSSSVDSTKEKKHRHKKHHKDRNSRKEKRRDYDSEEDTYAGGHPATSPPPEYTSIKESPPSDREEQRQQSSESLSIEETNKLRAKLGLKPLSLDTETVKTEKDEPNKKKDEWGEFYHKPAQNLAEKTVQEKLRKKLSDQKEKRALEGKLAKVKLLAEESDDDDASAWVKKSKQLEAAKREAEKRSKILEELDEQFGIGAVVDTEIKHQKQKSYAEKHLRGMRVEHDTESFQEGKTLILTLKDQAILAEDGDVLVNVNLLDDERYQKSNENKKKKPGYNAYEQEEVDEFGQLKQKEILDKYDEEDKAAKGFAIGQDNSIERKQAMMRSIKSKLANKRLESLALPEPVLASDYYNEEEMEAKFKKPKKKIKKLRDKKDKSLIIDDTPSFPDEVGTSGLATEFKAEPKEEKEIERALTKARKKTYEERQSDVSWLPIKNEPMESEFTDSGNIILNSTAEFCRTLGDIPTYGKSGNRDEELLEDMDTGNESDDVEIIEPPETGGTWNSVDPGALPPGKNNISLEAPILDEEPDVGSGVGAALKLAMSKGYLDKEENNRPSNTRLAHLQAKHYSIEDKSYGDDDKGGRRERYSGPIQDFREKDSFKPNVKLEYIGDDGHILNSKEAFRYLSHKFHGKGPGKNKIEKRLKKTQQEVLMKKMSSTDTPLGTLNMLQSKQKEMQSPYIVLSGSKHTHNTSISKARR